MTANVMPEQRTSYLAAGMATVVAKPVDVRELAAALVRVVGVAQADVPVPPAAAKA